MNGEERNLLLMDKLNNKPFKIKKIFKMIKSEIKVCSLADNKI